MKITVNEALDTILINDVTNSVGDYVVGLVKLVNSDGDIIYKNDDYDTPNLIEEPDIVMMTSDEFSYAMPSVGGSIIKDTYTAYYKYNTGVTSATHTGDITGVSTSRITIDGLTSGEANDIRKFGVLKITTGALAGLYTIADFDYTGSTATFNINETIAVVSTYSGGCIKFASVSTTEEEKVFVYQPEFPSIDIEMNIDYSAKTLESKDITIYNLLNDGQLYSGTVTRTHVITPPSGATYSVTTTTAAIKKLFNIWTNIWQTTITSSVQWDISSTYIVISSLSGSDYVKVLQGACSCEMLDCIKNLYNSWLAALSSNPSTERSLRESIMKVSYNYMLYKQAELCGEDTTEYCNNIKAVLASNDCDCEMEYSDAPSTALTSTSSTTPIYVHFVSGVPSSSVGDDGDIAFSDNLIIYQKESGSWTAMINNSSMSTYIVSGVPSSSIGDDNDIALSDNYSVYKKVSGSWVSQYTINVTRYGTGAPNASLGNNGDTYISSQRKVYTKSGGAWAEQVDMSTDNSKTYQVVTSIPLNMGSDTTFTMPIYHSCTLIKVDFYITELPSSDCNARIYYNSSSIGSTSTLSGASTIGQTENITIIEQAMASGDELAVHIVANSSTSGKINVIYTLRNDD